MSDDARETLATSSISASRNKAIAAVRDNILSRAIICREGEIRVSPEAVVCTSESLLNVESL